MLEEVREAADRAVREGGINYSCAQQIIRSFAQQLIGYTYLVR